MDPALSHGEKTDDTEQRIMTTPGPDPSQVSTLAATATEETQVESKLLVQVRVPQAWLHKLHSESAGRTVMLCQLLESFNDGVDGVKISIDIL